MLKLMHKVNPTQGRSGLAFCNIHRCCPILPWEVLGRSVGLSVCNLIFEDGLLVDAGWMVIPQSCRGRVAAPGCASLLNAGSVSLNAFRRLYGKLPPTNNSLHVPVKSKWSVSAW